MKRTPRTVIALALLVAAAGCDKTAAAPTGEGKPSASAGAGAGVAGGASAAAAVSVKVAPIVARDIDRSVEISGSLAASEDATIAAEVEGKLVSMRADLGDRVRSGELLARINPDEYRYRMEQAEAQREQAELKLKRTEPLAKTEMVAASALDDARTTDAAARATASLAKKKFSDTEVRAPFAGAVSKRLATAGEYVRPGQPLYQIMAMDSLKLVGEVPERYLALVKTGDPVDVQIDAFPGRSFVGKVSRLSPAVNPQTRGFAVEARIGNDDGSLKPGVFARARLKVGAAKGALVVPESALATFAGVSKVFVVDGGKAAERPVEIEQRMGDGTIVVRGAGLAAGQSVAIAGLGRLGDAMPVTVIK